MHRGLFTHAVMDSATLRVIFCRISMNCHGKMDRFATGDLLFNEINFSD